LGLDLLLCFIILALYPTSLLLGALNNIIK
jgi:hypothetical protein